MDGITWQEMFGRSYDQDYDAAAKIKINLTAASKDRKALGPQAPAVASLLKLLPKAIIKSDKSAQDYGQGAVTPHNAGAAIDIFYHKKEDSTRAFAHGLLSLFIKHRATIMWGTIEYNQMEFTQSGVTTNSDGDPHFDHIHIDWIDYARSNLEISKKFASFDYINEAGNRVTKTVRKFDQRMAMYWNQGARQATFDAFDLDLDELNRSFESQKTSLAAMTLKSFSALYAPVPPPAPSPVPSPPAESPQEKHSGIDYWLNKNGLTVHPNAPDGGGGAGSFRLVGSLTWKPFAELPHPWAPSLRSIDPFAISPFQWKRDGAG